MMIEYSFGLIRKTELGRTTEKEIIGIIFSGHAALPDRKKKGLLVATIRVPPTSSHNNAVKGKSGRGPALGHFLFFPLLPK